MPKILFIIAMLACRQQKLKVKSLSEPLCG